MFRVLTLLLLFASQCFGAERYNGSAWETVPAKRWNGSAWVDTIQYRYDGAQWVDITPSGGSSPGSVGITSYTTESAGRSAGTIYLTKYTATAGQVNCLHALTRYVNSTGESIDIGLWTSTGTLLGYVNVAGGSENTPSWKNGQLASAITLENTEYWIGAVSDDVSWALYYDNAAGNGRGTVSGTLGSLGNITPPSPTAGQQLTFYADYQEGSCGNPQ